MKIIKDTYGVINDEKLNSFPELGSLKVQSCTDASAGKQQNNIKMQKYENMITV